MKHIIPPYVPDVAAPPRDECFDSFHDLMSQLNIDWWLSEKPGSGYQGFFQEW